VWLAVDDFGTGYSSLSYLHHDADLEGEDRQVVRRRHRDGDPSIMVAILSMAHSLGLTCVAEGVETRAQAIASVQLGCDHAQGYLWSRPVPADQLTDVLSSDRSSAAHHITAEP
jgi:EAL domain-containing protein (putative c-di-GMP-specific phosphodiesterase class I)